MGQNPDGIASDDAAVSGENLTCEEINRECAEWKNRRVERKAKAYHVPIGSVESEDLTKLKLVDFPSFAQLVFRLCPGFHGPIDQCGDQAENTGANRNQQGTLPARRTSLTLGIEN